MQIQPCGPLRGEITVPGDKSISHRAIMLGALANGTTHITGFLMGEDCLSTIDCFRKMGVEINITDDEVIVEGVGLHGLEAPSERCTPATPARPPACCAAFWPVSRSPLP